MPGPGAGAATAAGAAAAAAGAAPPSRAATAAAAPDAPWQPLGTPRSQLTLDFTLPTGQSFRWRRSGAAEFTGVIGRRVVQVRQEANNVAWRVIARGAGAGDDAQDDAAELAEYFNLGVDLEALYAEWAAADARFAKVCAGGGIKWRRTRRWQRWHAACNACRMGCLRIQHAPTAC